MKNVLMKAAHTSYLVPYFSKPTCNHDKNMLGKLELHFLGEGKKVSLITEFALIIGLKGDLLSQVKSHDSIRDLSPPSLTRDSQPLNEIDS